MRTITYKERSKHGCWLCHDMVKKLERDKIRCFCPHESCPYRELDEYDSYEDYMEANTVDPMFLKHLFALERHDRERQQKSS